MDSPKEAASIVLALGHRIRLTPVYRFASLWQEVCGFLQWDVPARHKMHLLEFIFERQDLPEGILQHAYAEYKKLSILDDVAWGIAAIERYLRQLGDK